MKMKLDSSRPLYLQIMDEIKKRAVLGHYAPGSKLPSVRDMAKEIEVNPNTIARVYNELERELFIETRRGMGSYLSNDISLIKNAKDTLIKDAVENFIKEIASLNLDDNTFEKMIASIQLYFEKDISQKQ